MTSKEKEDLKIMFKGYKKVNPVMRKKLESHGLKCIDGGKHLKIVRQDKDGGVVVISKSPSDIRASLNNYKYIVNLIEYNN